MLYIIVNSLYLLIQISKFLCNFYLLIKNSSNQNFLILKNSCQSILSSIYYLLLSIIFNKDSNSKPCIINSSNIDYYFGLYILINKLIFKSNLIFYKFWICSGISMLLLKCNLKYILSNCFISKIYMSN